MGGNSSSKQSSEVLRNKRLREFEETLEQREKSTSSRAGSLVSSNDNYFSGFLRQSSQTPLGTTEALEEDDKVPEVLKKDDLEVDAAIQELEETFKTLDSSGSQGISRSAPFREAPRSKSCGVPLSEPSCSPDELERLERQGTPMGPPYGYTRHRRPMGLAHLSKRNVGAGSKVPTTDANSKGASSAPPGVSNLVREPNVVRWELPKIDGFDIEKFREVNRSNDNNPGIISGGPKEETRLASKSEMSNGVSNALKPSYTNEELELFRNLEREVY